MAKTKAQGESSIVKEANKAYARRTPTKDYDSENVDFVLKVVDSLDAKDRMSFNRTYHRILDSCIESLGFKDFILDFYIDCGTIPDIEYIFKTHGVKFSD